MVRTIRENNVNYGSYHTRILVPELPYHSQESREATLLAAVDANSAASNDPSAFINDPTYHFEYH